MGSDVGLIGQPTATIDIKKYLSFAFHAWRKGADETYLVWKKIEPQLVELLEARKKRREAGAREERSNSRVDGELWPRYHIYTETVPKDDGPLLSCQMLALTEPVRSIMEREDNGRPLPPAELDEAIPEAIRLFSTAKRRELTASLRHLGGRRKATHIDAEDRDDNDDGILHSASSFFRCTFCPIFADTPPQTYTAVVQHVRANHLRFEAPVGLFPRDTLQSIESVASASSPDVHDQAVKRAVEALKLVDLPADASMEQTAVSAASSVMC